MKKRYKIVLNVEIEDPDEPYPAGGDYARLTRLQGTVHALTTYYGGRIAKLTLDKIVEKGEVKE